MYKTGVTWQMDGIVDMTQAVILNQQKNTERFVEETK